jgi:hypothetical protein
LERADKERYSKAELRQRIKAHVAASALPERTSVGATLSFALMRELRAVERFLGNHPRVWTQWSASTCKQAWGEIEALAGLVEELKKRAGSQDPSEAAGRQSATVSAIARGVPDHAQSATGGPGFRGFPECGF